MKNGDYYFDGVKCYSYWRNDDSYEDCGRYKSNCHNDDSSKKCAKCISDNCRFCDICPAGTQGLSAYAYIYNLDAEVVPLETDITFSTNGIPVGITHVLGFGFNYYC